MKFVSNSCNGVASSIIWKSLSSYNIFFGTFTWHLLAPSILFWKSLASTNSVESLGGKLSAVFYFNQYRFYGIRGYPQWVSLRRRKAGYISQLFLKKKAIISGRAVAAKSSSTFHHSQFLAYGTAFGAHRFWTFFSYKPLIQGLLSSLLRGGLCFQFRKGLRIPYLRYYKRLLFLRQVLKKFGPIGIGPHGSSSYHPLKRGFRVLPVELGSGASRGRGPFIKPLAFLMNIRLSPPVKPLSSYWSVKDRFLLFFYQFFLKNSTFRPISHPSLLLRYSSDYVRSKVTKLMKINSAFWLKRSYGSLEEHIDFSVRAGNLRPQPFVGYYRHLFDRWFGAGGLISFPKHSYDVFAHALDLYFLLLPTITRTTTLWLGGASSLISRFRVGFPYWKWRLIGRGVSSFSLESGIMIFNGVSDLQLSFLLWCLWDLSPFFNLTEDLQFLEYRSCKSQNLIYWPSNNLWKYMFGDAVFWYYLVHLTEVVKPTHTYYNLQWSFRRKVLILHPRVGFNYLNRSIKRLAIASLYQSSLTFSSVGFLFLTNPSGPTAPQLSNFSTQFRARFQKTRLSFFYKNDIKKKLLIKPTSLKLLNAFQWKDSLLDTFLGVSTGFRSLYLNPWNGSSSLLNTYLPEALMPLRGGFMYQNLEPYKPVAVDGGLARLRFKPGYQRLWRRAREAFNYVTAYNYRYQVGLTKKIARLRCLRYNQYLRLAELKLVQVLLNARLVCDITFSHLLVSSNTVFINGFSSINPQIRVFHNDIIQLIVNLRYYVVYRWLVSWNFYAGTKLVKLLNFKNNTSRVDLSKQPSSHLPDWIIKVGYRRVDIPKYLEVDYFTLSIFVLYEPLFTIDYNPLTYLTARPEILSLYNWKYIT